MKLNINHHSVHFWIQIHPNKCSRKYPSTWKADRGHYQEILRQLWIQLLWLLLVSFLAFQHNPLRQVGQVSILKRMFLNLLMQINTFSFWWVKTLTLMQIDRYAVGLKDIYGKGINFLYEIHEVFCKFPSTEFWTTYPLLRSMNQRKWYRNLSDSEGKKWMVSF